MRRSMAIVAGLGIGLVTAATALAEAERSSPQVLTLAQRPAAGPGPTILRGSAVKPKAAPAARST